ncbi:MAG: hypothetical protein ACJ8G7_21680 [Rhizobacter sp.]
MTELTSTPGQLELFEHVRDTGEGAMPAPGMEFVVLLLMVEPLG